MDGVDGHLAQGQNRGVLAPGARGHEHSGLGEGRRGAQREGQAGQQAKRPQGYG